jgi:hypothetical protein
MHVHIFTMKYLVLQPQQKIKNRQKLEHVSRYEILFLDLDFCYFSQGQTIRYFIIKFYTQVE